MMSSFSDLLSQFQDNTKQAISSSSAAASLPRSNDNNKTNNKTTDCNKKKDVDEQTHYRKKKRSNDNHDNDENGIYKGVKSKRRRNNHRHHQSYDSRTNDNSHYKLPGDVRALKGMKVSFMCIGAQKAGTTWLYEMLRSHPHLSLSHQKELHFWDWHRHYGLGWYRRQFVNDYSNKKYNYDDDNDYYGEMTPCYAVLNDSSIREIRALFPKLKIIFIARDIVDRTWSALIMELRNAVRGMDCGSFVENKIHNKTTAMKKMQEEQQADPNLYDDDYFMERVEHSTHWSRSDYATSIRSWLKHFPPQQILLLNYNDIVKQPKQLLTQICQHLSVESDILFQKLSPKDLTTKINSARITTNTNSSSQKNHQQKQLHQLRPSLRFKMQKRLQPLIQDFNFLLKELGYSWTLQEEEKKDCNTSISQNK